MTLPMLKSGSTTPCGYSIKPQIQFKRIGEEGLVYDDHSETIHIINNTACLVLEMCSAHTSTQNIIDHLCSEFGITPELARADLQEIFEDFLVKNILEASEDGLRSSGC